ncbi:beta-1,3-glucanase family protein [Salinactinospora qingdaonensis]|uniref:Glycoside hydrolase family 64 protein n=1 Tax=Salinactinospora qingdaonensis TaxID=702744 RepID=A0ABP7EYI4_9ACTN
MINRRSFLSGFALAVAGTPLMGCRRPGAHLASAAPAAQAASGALPLSVVNASEAFPDSQIRLYIVGTDLATGRQCHVTSDGTAVPVQLSDNVDDGYTDYAIPLPQAGAGLSLPHMSGRIYIALGAKLRFKAVTAGDGSPALAYPAGWVDSDPNFEVMHDYVEFTHDGAGMHCNTTMVDQFSVPIGIRLVGRRDQSTGTLVEGGRTAIFDALAAHPDFSPLLVGDRLRVIAPGHGLDAGRFAGDYFAPYIDEVWRRYTDTDLRVTTDAGTFTGRVDPVSQELRFDGGVDPITKPSTRDVFFCHGALAAPNDGLTGPVAAVLGAAFNRSTLLDSAQQPTGDPAGFYQTDISNHYARILHANTVDGRAYGFAFDDVEGFAPYIEDGAPTLFEITLTPF